MDILSPTLLLSFLFLFLQPPITAANSAVYTSKTTFFSDYEKMMTNLKIFIYPTPNHQQYDSTPFSLLHNSLLASNFLTHNPNQATLFFLPFPPLSTRSLDRHIQLIRTSFPYWNRSLGADHFYFSCQGVGPSSSRNVVELKKNAIQIACFPVPAREFIPHKDVTLPSFSLLPRAVQNEGVPTRLLGYWSFAEVQSSVELINGFRNDGEFLIEFEPSDEGMYVERVQNSKFCLFVYDVEGLERLSVALAQGCVPVVITNRPMQDLPLIDVIKWSEIAVFVSSNMGSIELKKALIHTCEDGTYEKMRQLGVAVTQHFAWNESSPKPYDAFHMVMYQLWVRRHSIRYSKWKIM
ncbi:probable glycosyltransferase At5g03795 [Chenopodium quinoa]|uniref:probable glycosyltransferase At5g03795 n=1 Tax=Chenopodium quinoa TaxID=63459 RepID=UPI000B784193|nr:probable glycosyltransferase At5g03795 [Chenopodium quinoa]